MYIYIYNVLVCVCVYSEYVFLDNHENIMGTSIDII